MKYTFEADDMIYCSEGSIGNCEKCHEKGLYFDENGSYLCEDCLSENHDKGLYGETDESE